MRVRSSEKFYQSCDKHFRKLSSKAWFSNYSTHLKPTPAVEGIDCIGLDISRHAVGREAVFNVEFHSKDLGIHLVCEYALTNCSRSASYRIGKLPVTRCICGGHLHRRDKSRTGR